MEQIKAIEKIAPLILGAVIPENARPCSKVEAYNLPPELNTLVFQYYKKFYTESRYAGRIRWERKYNGIFESQFLNGFILQSYGIKADKFYIYKLNHEQQVSGELAMMGAIQEFEKECLY